MRSGGLAHRIGERFSTVGELFGMLGRGKRWWAIPAFMLLIGLSFLLIVLNAMPYVAPFIYTVF